MPEKCVIAGKWTMELSLCVALGLHWCALQSGAWVGMLINYSRSGSVASAIEKTFDGQHPCPLCRAISKGEQSGKKQDFQFGGKIVMDCVKREGTLIPPLRDFAWPGLVGDGSGFSPEPSVPPPRMA